MKRTYDYDDAGTPAFERAGNYQSSPYFYTADFYNMESTDSLTILPKFKTCQQISWWSCGVCASLEVMDYYGKLEDWNEQNLADLRTDHSNTHIGTCTDYNQDGYGAYSAERFKNFYLLRFLR